MPAELLHVLAPLDCLGFFPLAPVVPPDLHAEGLTETLEQGGQHARRLLNLITGLLQ